MSLPSTPNVDYLQSPDSDENDFCYCLERIDLLFQSDYLNRITSIPVNLQHFFLNEDEIELRFKYPQGMPLWLLQPGIFIPDNNEILTIRLNDFIKLFRLSTSERDIFLAVLLPRLSQHYAMLPASGMEDGVSHGLLTRLFSNTQDEYQILQSIINPASALFKFFLLSENEKVARNSKNSPCYRVNESVWRFFCGTELDVAGRHTSIRQISPAYPSWYPKNIFDNIDRLCFTRSDITPPVIVLEGNDEDGREQALACFLAKYLRTALCLDIAKLASQPEAMRQEITAGIVRDALLQRSVLVIENYIEPVAIQAGTVQSLEQILLDLTLPVFILPRSGNNLPVFSGLASVHLTMSQPDATEKAEFLYRCWPDKIDNIKSELYKLAQRYAFKMSDVAVIMQEAEYYRQIRNKNSSLSIADLRQTLALRSRKNFGNLAQRSTPVRSFDDIILSPALQKQLKEILAVIRFREDITEKHFSYKTGGKTGISVLFYGDSGTGKTLAAEVLASQLQADLIKVDLSAVVNKYIGETEKNLARIFDLAQADSGVLFFDEADALFGKRSEVKDAHDRHANIEVSYLLQRLENYPGLVILATNNRNHLDSAFNRRFTFITRFTHPDVSLRKQMWQSGWPASLKIAEDVNFDDLAARNELTGANIRNIAILAAILAADEKSDTIKLEHIERAVIRELGKIGRLSL